MDKSYAMQLRTTYVYHSSTNDVAVRVDNTFVCLIFNVEIVKDTTYEDTYDFVSLGEGKRILTNIHADVLYSRAGPYIINYKTGKPLEVD